MIEGISCQTKSPTHSKNQKIVNDGGNFVRSKKPSAQHSKPM